MRQDVMKQDNFFTCDETRKPYRDRDTLNMKVHFSSCIFWTLWAIYRVGQNHTYIHRIRPYIC